MFVVILEISTMPVMESGMLFDQDIRVEFNPVDGEGFSLSEVGKRLDVSRWGASTRNNRFSINLR